MIRKALAVLLALALFISAAPLALAGEYDNLWLVYYADETDTSVTAIIVAPAKYTGISDTPKIETVCTDGAAEGCVVTAEAEQITFYFLGETGPHWALRAVCPLPEGCVLGYNYMLAVLPGSATDASGNASPRVYFEDGTEYREAKGYFDIDVYSSLLQRDYAPEDTTVAVGDTLRVEYSGLYPVEIFINGAKAAALTGGEMQEFTCGVTGTGALNVSVRQYGQEAAARSFTVITSQEMYERNLRDGLISGEDIPTTEDLVDVGLPAGSLYIVAAKIVAFFVLLREFFFRLFSFSRISG
jgi:hypothetical protein